MNAISKLFLLVLILINPLFGKIKSCDDLITTVDIAECEYQNFQYLEYIRKNVGTKIYIELPLNKRNIFIEGEKLWKDWFDKLYIELDDLIQFGQEGKIERLILLQNHLKNHIEILQTIKDNQNKITINSKIEIKDEMFNEYKNKFCQIVSKNICDSIDLIESNPKNDSVYFLETFQEIPFYEDYEKDMLQAKYQIGNFEITEYNCDCTLQENIFYIKDLKKNIIYRIEGISAINVLESNVSTTTNQWILNIFGNIKLCENNLVELKNDMIYLYALSPENEDYTKHCYEIAGYINSNHIIVKFNDEIKIKSQIQIQKQPLYKEPNENTKMDIQLNVRDLVEILEEKEDWIYILYITKDNKKIKAWIPKNALEFKSSQVE